MVTHYTFLSTSLLIERKIYYQKFLISILADFYIIEFHENLFSRFSDSPLKFSH